MADPIRQAFVGSIEGDGAYVSPMTAIEAVTAAHARKRAKHGLATIWEQLAHMVFWQDVMLTRMRGQVPPPVPHDVDGWPKMPPVKGQDEAWAGLVEHFAVGLKEAEKVARKAKLANKMGPKLKRTFADQIMHLSIHNAYHAGQIVSLRRLIGNWPPPSGGATW